MANPMMVKTRTSKAHYFSRVHSNCLKPEPNRYTSERQQQNRVRAGKCCFATALKLMAQDETCSDFARRYNTAVLHRACLSQACARAWWCEEMLAVPQMPHPSLS